MKFTDHWAYSRFQFPLFSTKYNFAEGALRLELISHRWCKHFYLTYDLYSLGQNLFDSVGRFLPGFATKK